MGREAASPRGGGAVRPTHLRRRGEVMFKQLKLTGKIIGSILVTLALTSGASFWITQRRVNQQAEEAFRDKVRQITGMATATRTWFSDNIEQMVPNKEF